jgi:peptidoglycan/LPS O-acetylase OafA/YrhL
MACAASPSCAFSSSHGGSTAHISARLLSYLGNAEVGVRIFFALSSFLIYNLSQREIARTGGFIMLQFYKRRLLRIFPLLLQLPDR